MYWCALYCNTEVLMQYLKIGIPVVLNLLTFVSDEISFAIEVLEDTQVKKTRINVKYM